RGESWRFGIVQTFTIWVNPFSVVTYVRGIEKPLFPALSLRTLRSQRLCVRTKTRNQQRFAEFKHRSFHVMASRQVRQVREVADFLPFADFADFA
ncbi:MAG: hypothetical protein IJR99_03395, partial [Kiritimatiellae bacterium]|nr:hypothetical protein [Kiritimatiellia bacterium]